MPWFILFLVFISLLFLLVLKNVFWVPEISDLLGKHVLITGGSSGIGKSVALEAAKLGAHVTIVARNEIKLQEAVEEITKAAKNQDVQKIQFVSLDVTCNYDTISEILIPLEEKIGPVFLLINCAGMANCDKFEDVRENDLRHMMNVNYFGTVFPTLAIAKEMKKRRKGHIVITGSQASLLGIFGMSGYCSSKFALRGFAESLHMELKPYDVFVSICLPPDTNTPGFEVEEKSKPEITRKISETAGLFEPDVVARQLLSDALRKKFFSVVGFEGFVLSILCAGMSPISSFSDGLLQISLMSVLRFVSVGYLLHFQRIITNGLKSSSNLSSAEKFK